MQNIVSLGFIGASIYAALKSNSTTTKSNPVFGWKKVHSTEISDPLMEHYVLQKQRLNPK